MSQGLDEWLSNNLLGRCWNSHFVLAGMVARGSGSVRAQSTLDCDPKSLYWELSLSGSDYKIDGPGPDCHIQK